MILILTGAEDAHADHVAAMLRDRGAAFCRFDPGKVPARAAVALRHETGERTSRLLLTDDGTIDLDSVDTVWYRRPNGAVAAASITDRAAREFVELEASMVLHGLWSSMRAAWLPGLPLNVRRAEYKAFQLDLASRLGFELPPTLMTNSPTELLAFHRRHGRIICKHAATAFAATIGFGMVRYTELVTPRDLMHFRDVAHCPMTFQAYVPKRIELRVTVVGSRVFAAEIHSQSNRHTRFDWRRYDLGRTTHRPHTLTRDIERRCLMLVEALGLQYGAIDLIVTPDDRYVFLEINPNGQYLWIEEITGLPISEAICELLIGDSGFAAQSLGVS
jgi:hypothetical protein